MPKKKRKVTTDQTWRGRVTYPSEFDSEPDNDLAIGQSILWHGHLLPHEETPLCWCEPDILFFDPETGECAYEHKRTH